MREAIEGREYAKFTFSKNLSLALEILASWGLTTDLSRDELAHVSLDDLRALHDQPLTSAERAAILKTAARRNQKLHQLTLGIELPLCFVKQKTFLFFLFQAHTPTL